MLSRRRAAQNYFLLRLAAQMLADRKHHKNFKSKPHSRRWRRRRWTTCLLSYVSLSVYNHTLRPTIKSKQHKKTNQRKKNNLHHKWGLIRGDVNIYLLFVCVLKRFILCLYPILPLKIFHTLFPKRYITSLYEFLLFWKGFFLH